MRAADETIAGQLDEHYPLYVWRKAMKDSSTLGQAALASGQVEDATYDKAMNPKGMVG